MKFLPSKLGNRQWIRFIETWAVDAFIWFEIPVL